MSLRRAARQAPPDQARGRSRYRRGAAAEMATTGVPAAKLATVPNPFNRCVCPATARTVATTKRCPLVTAEGHCVMISTARTPLTTPVSAVRRAERSSRNGMTLRDLGTYRVHVQRRIVHQTVRTAAASPLPMAHRASGGSQSPCAVHLMTSRLLQIAIARSLTRDLRRLSTWLSSSLRTRNGMQIVQ